MSTPILSAPPVSGTCAENLDILGQMSSFNQWNFDAFRAEVGRQVLEVGSGNGRFSAKMLELPGVERYIGLDLHPEYNVPVEALARTYPKKSIAFHCIDLDRKPLNSVVTSPVDTVVCLNVLEHLRDDGAALRNFSSVLAPGGRLILQVPAFQWLYGSIDEAVGHHRRYSRQALTDLVGRNGYDVQRCFYFNFVGMAAWIWHVKIRKLRVHPEGEMRLADRLVPLFKAFESLVPVPAGLSLFLVATKHQPAS